MSSVASRARDRPANVSGPVRMANSSTGLAGTPYSWSFPPQDAANGVDKRAHVANSVASLRVSATQSTKQPTRTLSQGRFVRACRRRSCWAPGFAKPILRADGLIECDSPDVRDVLEQAVARPEPSQPIQDEHGGSMIVHRRKVLKGSAALAVLGTLGGGQGRKRRQQPYSVRSRGRGVLSK